MFKHMTPIGQTHLVVAKQCKVNASDDGDGDIEPCARETVELLHLGLDSTVAEL